MRQDLKAHLQTVATFVVLAALLGVLWAYPIVWAVLVFGILSVFLYMMVYGWWRDGL